MAMWALRMAETLTEDIILKTLLLLLLLLLLMHQVLE